MSHFSDALLDRIGRHGAPVCVGFDPVYDKLPKAVREGARDDLDAIAEFAAQTMPLFAEHVPCVKFQSACFERYGVAGVGLYEHLTFYAQSLGLLVIGDVKRGDIGSTAEHYAAATLLDPPPVDDEMAGPDAVTVNSYFGVDGLRPFVDVAVDEGKGVFALVRTSNPSGDAIQGLELKTGGTVADAVAKIVANLGGEKKYVGKSGYSLLGAVVGATKPGDAARLRKLMPQQLFLVPGFGAQGGSADDVKACFKKDGTGAIITSSRAITYAYKSPHDRNWLTAIEQATLDFKRQVAAILQ